jgi:hypothetical protein
MRTKQQASTLVVEGEERVLEQTAIAPGAPAGIDPSAYAERLAQQLMTERAAALIAQDRARAGKAAKFGDAFVTASGQKVVPMVAFSDSVEEDGTEMIADDGTPAKVNPGWVTRWVRVEQDQWGRQNYHRARQRKREGWIEIPDPKTGKPLERPGYMAMQASPECAARYTAKRMPSPSSGALKSAVKLDAVKSIERINVGLEDDSGG